MATPQGFAVRAAQARESIFASLRTLFPDAKMPEIPQVSKHGAPHLQATQWETLADWLAVHTGTAPIETDEPEEVETEYDGLSRGELEKLVDQRGLTDYVEGTGAGGRVVKTDYVKVLTDADSGVYGEGFGTSSTVDLTDAEIDLDVEGDAFDSEGSAADGFNSQPASPR